MIISRYNLFLQETLFRRVSMEAKLKNAFKEDYIATCIIKGAMLAEIYELPKLQREYTVKTNALLPVDFMNWVSGYKVMLCSDVLDIKVNDLYNIFLTMYFMKQDREFLVSRVKRLKPPVPSVSFEYKRKKTFNYKYGKK